MKTLKKLITNPLSFSGFLLVIFFAGVAIAAPFLAPPPRPHDPYKIPRDGFSPTPKPPSEKHPFGTASGQYDVYYGVIWGTRTAFKVGLIITGMNLLIGLTVGSIAAYFGGWIDEILMRIVEIFMGFPFLVAAITLAAVLQPIIGRGIITGMIALIAFGWMFYARLIRGDILALKERDYVISAQAAGANGFRILFRHIIPNAIYPTLIVASMDIGSYVIAFAALSFLGLGAEVGYADWGQMISFARDWIPVLASYWWIVIYPGVAIILFVLGWNLIGDALRDTFDPRLRGTRAG